MAGHNLEFQEKQMNVSFKNDFKLCVDFENFIITTLFCNRVIEKQDFKTHFFSLADLQNKINSLRIISDF